jgi:hypothetical protein
MEERWEKAGELYAVAWVKTLKQDKNMPKYIFIILALALSGCLDYSASSNSSSSSNSSNSSGGSGSSSSSSSSSVSAYLAVSPPLTEVIRLEITDPFDKATLYYVRTTDYAPYRP